MALGFIITIRIMKKTLFSLGAFLFSTALIAQNKVVNNIQKGEVVNSKAPEARAASAGPESQWLSWASALFNNPEDFDIDPMAYSITLMPDSSTQINYSDGSYGHVWMHSVGSIFDPAVDASDDILEWLDDDNAYTVDSVAVPYLYERNLGSSIVDTLRIQILSHSTNVSSLINGGNPVEGSDFQTVSYNYVNNTVHNGVAAGQVAHEILVPLTEADTASSSWNYIEVAVPSMNVAAGERFGIFIDFIPGYSYAFGDSLENLNSFNTIGFEENDGEDALYLNTLNKSYVLPSEIRYDTDEGWAGTYIPTMAYTETFVYEHFLFEAKISSPNVGTVELDGISFDVSPNPSNGVITISSTEDLNNVNLNVVNLIGQTVMNTTINGTSSNLDLTSLNKGIYLMNFNMEGKTVTKKIVLK